MGHVGRVLSAGVIYMAIQTRRSGREESHIWHWKSRTAELRELTDDIREELQREQVLAKALTSDLEEQTSLSRRLRSDLDELRGELNAIRAELGSVYAKHQEAIGYIMRLFRLLVDPDRP